VADPLLDLLDYRRRVNEMYDAVRSLRDRDPRAAHRLWRERRDELFRSHAQSALPESERAAFRGLPYHEYDPAFAFSAAVRPLPRPNGLHAGRPTRPKARPLRVQFRSSKVCNFNHR